LATRALDLVINMFMLFKRCCKYYLQFWGVFFGKDLTLKSW